MNEYRLRIDESHVVDTLTRRRQVQGGRVWWLAVRLICAFGLTGLLALVVIASMGPSSKPGVGFLVALVPLTFLFLLALGPRIDYWFMKRRLKKSPFYGNELLINVAESGVSLTTPGSKTELSWSVFTMAHYLSDGILVFLGPSQFEWWPNAALVVGHRGEVERVVRLHVARQK